jgi:hypothetical protein
MHVPTFILDLSSISVFPLLMTVFSSLVRPGADSALFSTPRQDRQSYSRCDRAEGQLASEH